MSKILKTFLIAGSGGALIGLSPIPMFPLGIILCFVWGLLTPSIVDWLEN